MREKNEESRLHVKNSKALQIAGILRGH